MKKRLYSLLLSFAMMLLILPGNIAFAENIAEGSGWSLDKDGILTLNRTFTFFYSASEVPWHSYRSSIKGAKFYTSSIPNFAFDNCSNLKEITIPSNVTKIGMFAFNECKNLNSVVLPDGITEINQSTFRNCKSLVNINIPTKIDNISTNAFQYCTALKEMDFSKSKLRILGGGALSYCTNLKYVAFPDTTTTIESSALNYCSSLEYISLSNSITKMEGSVLYGCDSLKTLTIPKQVEGIYLSHKLPSLQTLKILCSIEKITGCESLIELYIPTSAKTLELSNCKNLKSVWYGGSEEEWSTITKDVSEDFFENIDIIYDCDNAVATDITLNKQETTIDVGMREMICAKILPQNAMMQSIHWYSDDETIAKIDNNGIVTGVSTGTTVIIAEDENNQYMDACVVNVQEHVDVTDIKLDYSEISLFEEETKTLQASVLPENASNKNVIWSSSNQNIATVADGKVYALSPGNTTISAKTEDGGLIAKCDVTINEVQHITGIGFPESSISVSVNQTKELVVNYTPENATYKNVTWKSSKPAVATVENGTVKGISTGTAVITATSEDGGFKAACIITVTQPVTPSGVTLDKTELSLNIGSTSKVNATVLPENAENKNVSWTSSNTDVADVDSNGNITAKSIGNTEIKAETEIGGYTAICKVSVLPINVSGIALSSSEVSLAEKATTTISATITPENATDKTVIWSSNNEKVATVTNGVITGISEGTAVIIAKTNDGNYTAYCAVTVTAAKVSVKSISLNQSSVTIVEGYTDTLSASIKPENATNQNVLWSSNNKNVATVDNGVITAVTPGTAVVIATAEDGGQIATCIVNVVSAMQAQVSKPIASVLSGAVQTGENILLLTATRGAEIHYTTDGSAPTKDSKLYTEPIQINEALKLKAVAIKSGMVDSDVASFSYTMADPNVPYVSVQTNLTGNKGETTTVSVNISENSGSAGGSFNLVYDTDSVELVSVENGAYISKANPIVNDSYANNKIRTVWAGSKALSGGGEILSATFRILDSTQNDTAYFNLEKLKLADDNATKLTCLQSNGVLALMSVDTAVQDKEFLTQSVLAEDNKTLSVTVSANTEDTAKLYAAVYDDKQLIQIKSIDVMKNSEPYNIVFDTAVKDTQVIKVFVWDENMMPLSTGETVEK